MFHVKHFINQQNHRKNKTEIFFKKLPFWLEIYGKYAIIKSKQMLCICAPHEMRLTVQSTVALLLKQ